MRLNVIGKKHECGSCTECCTVMGVHELGKPCFAKCEHVSGSGCGIYKDRPHTCSNWHCGYAAGFLGNNVKWRPDNCGVLFTFHKHGNDLVLDIYQTTPVATPLERLEYLVKKIGETVPFHTVKYHSYGLKMGHLYETDNEKYPEGLGLYMKYNEVESFGRGWFRGKGVREPNAEELRMLGSIKAELVA